MLTQIPRAKALLRRLAEDNLVQNLDSGEEYTGFKDIYTLIPENYISESGHVYDIQSNRECAHIIKFLRELVKEAPPEVKMTCGSFFSANKQMQKKVSGYLNTLSRRGAVSVYAGGDDVRRFFEGSVRFSAYNRHRIHIPHFIKTNKRFLLALPHTEKKQVRVDIVSDMLEQETKNKVLKCLDELIANIDNKGEN